MNMDTQMIMDAVASYGIKIALAIAIFMIGKRIAKLAIGFVKKMMIKASMDETLTSFAGNIMYGLSMAFIVIAALSQLGVDTTSLAAILAAAGLAIGLALQGSLSNFASGVLIILFHPFKIGDWVDIAGVAGTVEEISIFTTVLTTGDNKQVIIPNGTVTSNNIINNSTKPTRRVDLVIGVGYDDDLKKVKKVLTKIVEKHDLILKEPATKIAVSELAENSVNFVVKPWVKAGDYWTVHADLLEEIKLTFDKEGISFPYPQRDVHIIGENTGSLKKAA
ncbi:MAG: mechanosensitive ion channel [Alphaproteobacteria bacterium]|nr:mechanosensitive ion channel [Alphaproteobacteria bacterium]